MAPRPDRVARRRRGQGLPAAVWSRGRRLLAKVPALEPGDIVIMDNLGCHRGNAIRAASRAVGARLIFLPKYSPDLNPIEMFFASSSRAAERQSAS